MILAPVFQAHRIDFRFMRRTICDLTGTALEVWNGNALEIFGLRVLVQKIVEVMLLYNARGYNLLAKLQTG